MDAPPSSLVPNLRTELESLPPDLRHALDANGFSADRLLALAKTLEGSAEERAARRDARNRVQGTVRGPTAEELPELPKANSPEAARLEAIGEAILKRGELAFAVLAGGMATRMGGVVKALVDALPGRTFLDLRLAENLAASTRAGRPVPLWLMTSEATDAKTRAALSDYRAPAHVRVFRQDVGLRLTPDGHLFRGADGAPSVYSPGHGDLVDALRRSGYLSEFVATGGKYVWIANLDNLGAGIDPQILGYFAETHRDLMVEVCEKEPGDKGGIPAFSGGKMQVLEEFRLPKDFDPASVRVFNTNTFVVRAEPLAKVEVAWNWFEVEKKVDDRPAIQFERLLQELTGSLDAVYLRVPREGAHGRFLPAKDPAELARRRDAIEGVMRARGIL